jgi:hypothetical protein
MCHMLVFPLQSHSQEAAILVAKPREGFRLDPSTITIWKTAPGRSPTDLGFGFIISQEGHHLDARVLCPVCGDCNVAS